MPNWYIRHSVDFERTPADRDNYTAPLVLMLPGDNQAHVWVVSAYADGQPVDLTGQTVQAFFTRTDGNTVAVTGTATGNAARVTLPRDVYLYRGELRAVMRLGDSVSVVTDLVTTLKEVTFYVKNGFGNIVDPQTSFPTVAGLAEDVSELAAGVASLGSDLTALTNKVNGDGWHDMGSASGVSAGSTGMGMDTGFICAYRVEAGHHVYAAADVALSFTYNSSSATKLNGVSVPESLRPTSRVVRVCPIDGPENYCRAFVNPSGDIYLEWIGSIDSGSRSSYSVAWSDILIDWFI